MTLKEDIKAELDLPEDDFDSHCSDLYIIHSRAVEEWLKKNYQFFKIVRTFNHENTGKLWFDVPRGYTEYIKKQVY